MAASADRIAPQIASATQDARLTTIDEHVDPSVWDEYTRAHREGGVYLRASWDVVFGTYGLRLTRLAALREGQMVGALPLVWQKSWLFGRRLVSLPWFDTAGIVADDDEARDALLQGALKCAAQLGADVLELRQPQLVAGWPAPRGDKALFRLRLEADPAALWNRIGAKVRNQVRKGEKLGLTVQTGSADLVDEFYAIYSANMRDLGSPPHSRRFFEQVVDSFPEEARAHVVRYQGTGVGAALTLDNGGRLEVPWASSLRKYNSYCVNHVMYWRLLEQACERGVEWFHFGRSSLDSGPYRFKKQWGAEALPLPWHPFQIRGVAQAQRTTHIDESYSLATRVWQRMPVSFCRLFGPWLIRKLP
jgi:FemAB-related protein (PEP-CTERM system-associated)